MSILSSFIRNQLLKGLEDEFVSHEPEIQEEIVQQIGEFAAECLEWVHSKLNGDCAAEPVEGEAE